MIDSLYIGASGMQAQQLNVNAISNNLANMTTPAYKKDRVNFQDLMYRSGLAGAAGPESGMGAGAALGAGVGSGVGVAAIIKLFQNGELKKTDGPLDIAISGKGFLEVTLPDGSSAYTRAGALQVTPEGLLANSAGYALHPAIRIPADAKDVLIDAAGKVTVSTPTDKNRVEVGQIELVDFVNPAGLTPLGENLFVAREEAGTPITGAPGTETFGKISQGYLEASNVKLVDEMMSLILAQRAYEMNAKAVQAADEMLGIVNNLRR
ncbi:MAG: flagellar basal-body rod protein FlgG [Burkholderiaceae bacterium]|nr:flagellar basal-body rod protein FlgG [Burkholderiaceae bacterium]